jgi:phosphatidylglycerol---prolipoprotein diacylglyceryl transferase
MIWNANPVWFDWGWLSIRGYGVLFALGFFAGFKLLQWMYGREGRPIAELDNLLLMMIAGSLVGARLMHCLVYEPGYYWAHPWEIPKVWHGGLASHGAAVGVLLVTYWYCRGAGRPRYLWLLDRVGIASMLAGASIRIGNFFNSEIVGVPTHSAIGVVFARVDLQPRHPVQLYEAAAYLAIFFILLRLYKRQLALRDGADGLLTGWYLVLVFGARFALEYVKAQQTAYELALPVSAGQLLCVPLIVAGIVLLVRAQRRRDAVATGNRAA